MNVSMEPTLAAAPSTAARWRDVRRVLAVRLDQLGDVLMTTPALAAIRDSLPGVRLDLLTSPGGAALAPMLPMLDGVIRFHAPWMKAGNDEPAHELGRAERRLVEQLAAHAFDAAVIFSVCTQSALPAALLCRLAGIPLRLAHSRENPYGLLSDWVPETDVPADGMRHEVERQLALAAHVGWRTGDARLRLAIDDAARTRLRHILQQAGIASGTRYMVLHVGATAPSRRYPAPCFGRAAGAIARRGGVAVVCTGDASEAALIETARACMGTPSLSLAGRLELDELAALIDDAALVVANNTGPMHIAAATQTPVVALYALTNPQHTPWQVGARVLNHPVPCRHCLKSVCPLGHQDCLRRVPPEDVVEAALALLAEPAEGRAA